MGRAGNTTDSEKVADGFHSHEGDGMSYDGEEVEGSWQKPNSPEHPESAYANGCKETSGNAQCEDADDDDDSSVDELQDPVVKEIDVYVNRLDESDIYVLQYPLRPVYRPYGDQGQLVKAEVREQQGTLRFHYALNTTGTNFDPNKRPNNAADATDENEDEESANRFSTILKSYTVEEPHCSYGLGVLRDDRLYITPVTRILQFRPDFAYVDADNEDLQSRAAQHVANVGTMAGGSSQGGRGVTADDPDSETGRKTSNGAPGISPGEKDQGRNESASSNVGGDSNSTGNEDGAIPTRQTWSGAELKEGMSEGRHRMPNSKIRAIQESEPWTQIDTIYDSQSPESFEILELLCSFAVPASDAEEDTEKNKDDALALSILGINDLSVASSDDTTKEHPEANNSNKPKVMKRVSCGPNVPEIRFFPHVEPYLEMLCGATSTRPVGSNELCTSTSGALSYLTLSKLAVDQQILQVLKHRHVVTYSTLKALLTRKLPDAELIKLTKSFGVLVFGNWVCKSHYVYDGYESLCRDLLLILLQLKGRATQREPFCQQTRLPMAVVTEMLQQVAEFRSTAWHFKVPADVEFIKQFPEEQAAADAWWKRRIQTVKEEITVHLQRQTAAATQRNSDASTDVNQSGSSKSNVDVAKLSNLARECLRQRGGMSIQQMEQEVADMSKTTPGIPLTGFTGIDLLGVLPGFALELSGLWVLKSYGGDPMIDTYRNVLISLFRRAPGPLTKEQIRAEFEAHLKRKDTLPDVMFRSLIREFAVNKNGYWIFKGELY